MKEKLQKILDITFWKFVLVGIINTLVGTTVMFVAYNFFHFNGYADKILYTSLAAVYSCLLSGISAKEGFIYNFVNTLFCSNFNTSCLSIIYI